MGVVSKIKSFFTRSSGTTSAPSSSSYTPYSGPTTTTTVSGGGTVTVPSSIAGGTVTIPQSLGGSGRPETTRGGGGIPTSTYDTSGFPQPKLTPEQIASSQRAQQQLGIPDLTAQQRRAIVQKQTQQQEQQPTFTGRLQQYSATGKPEHTRYIVRGEEIARVKAGEETFEPRGKIATGERATIKIDRPGELKEIEISETELIEREYQRGQRSAGEFVLGGKIQDAPPDFRFSVVEQQDLEAGADIQQVFGFQPTRYGTSSDFGQDRIDQKIMVPGTIYRVQTDTFKSPSGYDVPITAEYTIGEDWSSRPSTEAEIKELDAYSRSKVYEATATGKLETWRYDIQRARERTYQKGTPGFKREAVGFGLGVAASVTGTVLFGKQLITQPIKTVKDVYVSGRDVTSKFIKGERFPQVGQVIRTQPGFATGFVVTETGTIYSVSKVPKLIEKGVDITRTSRLTEIPKESVIAPEFFAGQRYPAIKPRQTAGQLLKEFQPATQYGVTRLRGFTASPRPFAPVTKAAKGASELPGVYQAPKVSPQFLRVASETDPKIFSLSPFGTLRPSVVKIQPTKFRLMSGVTPEQKSLTPLARAKEFFRTEAKPGESIIPFIKAEKEAIIPVGTQLRMVDKRFFFEFEKRKIPIYEFEALEGGELIKGTMDVGTAISSYSRAVTQRPLISSTDIVSSGRYVSYSRDVPSSSVFPVTSSSMVKSISSSSFKAVSSSISSGVSSSRSSVRSSASISKVPSSAFIPSKSIAPPISPPKSPPIRPRISKPPYAPPYIRPPTIKGPPGKPPSFRLKPQRQPKSFMDYRAEVRRFGKFQTIGKGSLRDVFNLGKSRVEKELGATFRVISPRGVVDVPTPKGFYKKVSKKYGVLLIEKKERRLKKGVSKEIPEIQYWKKIKSPLKFSSNQKRKKKRK